MHQLSRVMYLEIHKSNHSNFGELSTKVHYQQIEIYQKLRIIRFKVPLLFTKIYLCLYLRPLHSWL